MVQRMVWQLLCNAILGLVVMMPLLEKMHTDMAHRMLIRELRTGGHFLDVVDLICGLIILKFLFKMVFYKLEMNFIWNVLGFVFPK